MQSFLTIRTISFSSYSLCLSPNPLFSSKTLLNFVKMYPNRNHGWAPNPQKPPSFSSSRQSPNHHNKFNTPMNAARNVSSSHIGTSKLDSTSLPNTPIFSEQDFPALGTTQDKPKRPVSSSISSESPMSGTHRFKSGTPPQNSLPIQPVSMVESLNGGQGEGTELFNTAEPRQGETSRTVEFAYSCDSIPIRPSAGIGFVRDMGNNSLEYSESRTLQYRKSSPKRDHRQDDADKLSNSPFDICKKKSDTFQLKASLLERNKESRKVVENSSTDERPTFFRPSAGIGVVQDMGNNSSEYSKSRTPQYRKISPKRDNRHSSLDVADKFSNSPFDICRKKSEPFGIKPSLLERNRERRKVVESSLTDDRPTLLRPGMVLLKNYLTNADQINIVKKCRELGIGEGGFYQPGFKDGAKLRLHMMCLGKDWDPQIKKYGESRLIDGAKPPEIPTEFKKLVSDTIRNSHAEMQEQGNRNPDGEIPWMDPDICIVNFYTKSGKLGLHQDRDESRESIRSGLPVVSFSIGDSAEFLYGDERDADMAEKVMLNSGDVLIFGGESRLVYHGVPSIVPDSAPKFLAKEADLRPGRLNLTFRKY